MDVPWLGIKESCDYQCHINAHNSDLGDDFPMAVGTRIPAPVAGTLFNYTRAEPAPYKTLWFSYFQPDGMTDLFEFMHWSRFAPDGHYEEGETIGWSGGALHALGAGKSTGPHLHANAVINAKLAPVRALVASISEAGEGPVTPVTPPRRLDMTTIYNIPNTPTAALGGEAPGTAGNWIETQDPTIIAGWVSAHGPLVSAAAPLYASLKASYLSPLNIAGSGSPAVDISHLATTEQLNAAQAAIIDATPTSTENGDAARAAIVK